MADAGGIHPAERVCQHSRGAQSACQIYFTSHTLTGSGVSRLETVRQQASCTSQARLVAARLPTIFYWSHFDW